MKRKLFNNTPQYITTFQTYNQGSIDLDYHYFYAYLQPELSEYDAWFNVKDNLLVLGVSVKDNEKIGVYHQRFLDYMKEHHNLHIDKQTKADKWLMPHILPGCNIDYGVGRVLFAGEIAGFLNPMGEGISAGMESGYCVAQAVMHYFDNLEVVYSDYKERVEPLHSYMKRQWGFVAGIADTFSDMKKKEPGRGSYQTATAPRFFSWVQRLDCDAIERHFAGERYKSLTVSFPLPESRINQGFFAP